MHPTIFISAFTFIAIAALSAFLTRLIHRYATTSRSMLDIPNERSSHTVPTPRGGGLAIVVIVLSGLVLVKVFRPAICPWSKLLAFLAGAFLIAVISWLDDVYSLPAVVRFGAHSLAAIVVMFAFGIWKIIALPRVGHVDLGLVSPLITFVWIVGLTNSYNFMDGIDGIAGGQCFVAGLSWLLFGRLMNLPLAEVMGTLLAAASLGFLRYNWPPARIFMGDVGSAFLGYSFACLALIGSQKNPLLGSAGVLFVWPFIFDASITFFRRLKNRENVFAAHRSHLYQRLVISGYRHQSITLFYMGLDVLGLILALMIIVKEPYTDIMLIILLSLACFSLWGFTALKEKNYCLLRSDG